jgi:hypothetical protein
MGFPMTVERVIARNGLRDLPEAAPSQPRAMLLDDIRRLAEDSVTLERQRLREAVEAIAPNGWLPVGGDGWIQLGDGAQRMRREVLALLTPQATDKEAK